MKFDVKLPSLDGTARIEVKTVEEGERWAAYLAFVSDRRPDDACLMLGRQGVPYRFTGATEKEAEEAARSFLKKNYVVLRMIW